MKKVPLYTLAPDDKFKLENKVMVVTNTKTIHKEGKNSFQQFYCKVQDGNEFVHAPAGLIVEKVE